MSTDLGEASGFQSLREYLEFKHKMRTLSQEESLNLIQLREKESSIVWHEGVAKALRDLAVNNGLALSEISRTAKGEYNRRGIIPDHVVKEYKRLCQVYQATRRLKKSL